MIELQMNEPTDRIAKPAPGLPIAPSHLWQLDVLRAAAILMVFCFHLLGASHDTFKLYDKSPGGHWNIVPQLSDTTTLQIFYPFSLGQVGVVLFFVLSGFCIHHSILQGRRKAILLGDDTPRFNFIAFMLRRTWRIYPAYLAALFAFFIMQRVIEHRSGGPIFKGAGDLIWHALMLHNLRPSTFQSINASFWSLGVEWQFYWVYPIFLWLRNRTGIRTAVGITAVLSVACQIAVVLRHLDGGEHAEVWNNLPLITWFNWCLGALVAEYWDQGTRFFKMPTFVVAILWVILLVFAGYDPSSDWVSGIIGMAWPILFAVTLEFYIHTKRQAYRWERAITPIGLCSYSLYLLHQPLLSPMLNVAHRWLRLPDIRWVDLTFTGLVIFLVLFGMAWASYLWIEQPGTKLGQFFSRKVREAPKKANSSLIAA